jgi:hypothetical protein
MSWKGWTVAFVAAAMAGGVLGGLGPYGTTPSAGPATPAGLLPAPVERSTTVPTGTPTSTVVSVAPAPSGGPKHVKPPNAAKDSDKKAKDEPREPESAARKHREKKSRD